MEFELNALAEYKNIPGECLIVYLNLCESCQKKCKSVKKGQVIILIISSQMNSQYTSVTLFGVANFDYPPV